MELALKESVKKPDGTASGRSSLRAPAAGNPVRRPAAARSFLQLRPEDGENGRSEERPRPNRTGLPDTLKTSLENHTGLSLDEVRVHYNSSRPARYGALAFAKGTEIHIASGQEKSLPHEAWHVVQQMQGRVTPNARINGEAANTDSRLEREADEMGVKALSMGKSMLFLGKRQSVKIHNSVMQFDISFDELAKLIDDNIKKILKEEQQDKFKTAYKRYLEKKDKNQFVLALDTDHIPKEIIDRFKKYLGKKALAGEAPKPPAAEAPEPPVPEAPKFSIKHPLHRSTSDPAFKLPDGENIDINIINFRKKTVETQKAYDIGDIIRDYRVNKTERNYYATIGSFRFSLEFFNGNFVVYDLIPFGLAYYRSGSAKSWDNMAKELGADFPDALTQIDITKKIFHFFTVSKQQLPDKQSTTDAVAAMACDFMMGIRGEHAAIHSLWESVKEAMKNSKGNVFRVAFLTFPITKEGGRKFIPIVNQYEAQEKDKDRRPQGEQEIFKSMQILSSPVSKDPESSTFDKYIDTSKILPEDIKSRLKKTRHKKDGHKTDGISDLTPDTDSDGDFSDSELPAKGSVTSGSQPPAIDEPKKSRKRKLESGTDKKGDTDAKEISEPKRKKSPAPSFPPSPSTSLSGKDAADMAPQQNLPEPSQFPLSPEPRAPIPEPFSDDEDSEMEDAQKSASADKSTASEEPDKPKYGEEDSVTDTEDL